MLFSKSNSIGNTFTALICSAFGCHQKDVKIAPELQHGNCGTVEVSGSAFDWFDRGYSVEFIEAN